MAGRRDERRDHGHPDKGLRALAALTMLIVACSSDDDDAASSPSTTEPTATEDAPTETAAETTSSTTATETSLSPGGTDGGGAVARVTREQVDAALSEIDGLVGAEMERSGVPGVAVAVVYGDEVVFVEGYGVRDVGTQDPVSPETVFQLASLSKPITGTALAGLVSDGIISWDEPVHPYAPDLIFSDPWVTDHVTFADLYSHPAGCRATSVTRSRSLASPGRRSSPASASSRSTRSGRRTPTPTSA